MAVFSRKFRGRTITEMLENIYIHYSAHRRNQTVDPQIYLYFQDPPTSDSLFCAYNFQDLISYSLTFMFRKPFECTQIRSNVLRFIPDFAPVFNTYIETMLKVTNKALGYLRINLMLIFRNVRLPEITSLNLL